MGATKHLFTIEHTTWQDYFFEPAKILCSPSGATRGRPPHKRLREREKEKSSRGKDCEFISWASGVASRMFQWSLYDDDGGGQTII